MKKEIQPAGAGAQMVERPAQALRLRRQYSQNSLKAAASATGISKSSIEVVALGASEPIRFIEHEKRVALVIEAIAHVNGTYGGASAMDESILDECVSIVLDKFAGFGIAEIVEAFRAAAVGTTSVDLNLYGGPLNAAKLGQVLNAYRQFRIGVVRELERQRDEEARQATEAYRNSEEFRRRADEETLEIIRQAAESGKYDQRPEDIPAFWYDFLERTGHISLLLEEKWQLMEEAKQLIAYVHARKLDRATALADISLRKQVLEIRKEIEQGTQKGRDEIAFYAKKLAVFNHLQKINYEAN